MNHAPSCKSKDCQGCIQAGSGPGQVISATHARQLEAASADAEKTLREEIGRLQERLDRADKKNSDLELRLRGVPWAK
jgi:hypothetical protein